MGAGQLRTMIDSDRFRGSMRGNPSIEEVGHAASPKPKAWLYDHGFTTPLIDNRQNAERTCIEQLSVHEIHTQPLAWVCRLRNHATMETHVLTSSHPHPELQALETIQPVHALAIDPPSLTPQHHVDPQIAEPRPRMGNLTDPPPECRLIRSPALPVPGGTGKQPVPAGSPYADRIVVDHPVH